MRYDLTFSNRRVSIQTTIIRHSTRWGFSSFFIRNRSSCSQLFSGISCTIRICVRVKSLLLFLRCGCLRRRYSCRSCRFTNWFSFGQLVDANVSFERTCGGGRRNGASFATGGRLGDVDAADAAGKIAGWRFTWRERCCKVRVALFFMQNLRDSSQDLNDICCKIL